MNQGVNCHHSCGVSQENTSCALGFQPLHLKEALLLASRRFQRLHQLQSYIVLGFPRICITSLLFAAKILLCSTSTFWWALNTGSVKEKTVRKLLQLHVPEFRLRQHDFDRENDSLLGQTLLFWGSLTAFNASSSRECFSEESPRASSCVFHPDVIWKTCCWGRIACCIANPKFETANQSAPPSPGSRCVPAKWRGASNHGSELML